MNIHGHKLHAAAAAERERHWAGQEREWGATAIRRSKMFARIKKWHLAMVAELKGLNLPVKKTEGSNAGR